MKKFLHRNATDRDEEFYVIRSLFNGNITLPELLKSDPKTTGTNGKISAAFNGLWAKPQTS